MNFSIKTLIALISSAGLVASTFRFPLIGLSAMIGIPVVIMVVALTSPQRGTHLDPTGRWSFKLLSQIWVFSFVQILLLFLLANTTRTGSRFVRTLNAGSTNAYISVPLSRTEYEKILNVPSIQLFDSSGKVGDVADIRFYDMNSWNSNQSSATLVVATRRWYVPYEQPNGNSVEIRPNGVVFISR